MENNKPNNATPFNSQPEEQQKEEIRIRAIAELLKRLCQVTHEGECFTAQIVPDNQIVIPGKPVKGQIAIFNRPTEAYSISTR